MAFSDLGSLGATGSSGNNQTTLALTTTLTASVGNLVVLVIADDNTSAGADDDSVEVASVQNSGTANTWLKAKGWANNQGSKQGGASVSIWYTRVTAQITSGATITITFAVSADSDATAVTGRVFSLAAGMEPAIIATNQSSDDAADPSALDATTPNVAALRIRGIAGEIGTTTALTPTASWTAWAAGNSATTGTTSEMCARAEHIISTATGASSNPTWVACDIANAYVAFVERDNRWGWEGQGAQFVTQQPPPGGSNKSRAAAGAFAGPTYPVDVFVSVPPIIYGFDSQDDFFPLGKQASKARQGGALRQRVGFSIPETFVDYGFAVQSPQPPHRQVKRFASIAPRDDGIQQPFIPPTPIILPFGQLQDLKAAKRNLSALRTRLDIGFYNPWIAWQVDAQSPQLRQRRERFSAAFFKGQDGLPSPTPSILLTADYPWHDEPFVYPRKNFSRHYASIRHRSQFVFYSKWYNYGWDVQPPQPPQPKQKRFAAIAPKEDGNQAIFIPPTPVSVWFETPWVYPKRKSYPEGHLGESVFAIFPTWYNFGWEIQSVQPLQTKSKRFASILFKGQDAFPVRAILPWHETPWVYPPPPRQKRFGSFDTTFDIDAKFVSWKYFGFDAWPTQPPHPRRERIGAILEGIDGIDLPQVTTLQTAQYPWYETPWIYPRIRTERSGSLADKDDGIDKPFSRWINAGWEVQSPQPPRRRHEKWPLADWDDGNYSVFAVWRNFGWEVQHVQPPHQWIEKRGAIMPREDGIENIKSVGLQTGDYAWAQTPLVYTRKEFARWASIAPRDDGIYFPFTLWRNAGWEIQSIQPPHPRRERAGSIARGDDGNENIMPFGLQTADYAWAQVPWVYTRREWARWAAITPKDDGTQGTFNYWRNAGWEIQSPQPPRRKFERWAGALARWQDGIPLAALLTAAYPWHDEPFVYPRRKPELWGAIAKGDDGNQFRYERFINFGWPVQPWQPPRRKHELRGAIASRDDGTQYPLLRFFNFGWPIQPWQPPHPKYLHQYIQDIGSYPLNLYQFVPPPPIVPPRRRSKRLVSLFFQDERNVEVSDVRSNLQNPNIRRKEDTDPSR